MKTSAPQMSDGVTGWKVEVIKKLAAALRVLMAQSVLCWQKTDTESVCGVCVVLCISACEEAVEVVEHPDVALAAP